MRRYQHGGDIKAFAQDIGCSVDEVIDLSSNINFIKPSLDVDFNTIDISAYPNYDELYQLIAQRYHIGIDEIELYNGATTAIYSLFNTLNIKDISLYAPLYLEYERVSEIYGCDIEYINRFDDVDRSIKESSLVVFVNPSTPDGRYYHLDRYISKWIDRGATILIDESFLDFTPYSSAIEYLPRYDKLYILKSFTKFYSSAGIRIGAIISQKENIQYISKQEPIWKLSQFDTLYLQSALRDESFRDRAISANSSAKEYLYDLLAKVPYIDEVYPSSANYLLVRLKGVDAPTLQSRLKPYKILIRDCSNFTLLDSRYIRIAIKDMDSIDRLKEALCMISI
jgi:threonine-phosphate decarboxylase